jgi:hypothetical protein
MPTHFSALSRLVNSPALLIIPRRISAPPPPPPPPPPLHAALSLSLSFFLSFSLSLSLSFSLSLSLSLFLYFSLSLSFSRFRPPHHPLFLQLRAGEQVTISFVRSRGKKVEQIAGKEEEEEEEEEEGR